MGGQEDAGEPSLAQGPEEAIMPDLVPGEVIDTGEDAVSYRMADGSTWTNDARTPEASAC